MSSRRQYKEERYTHAPIQPHEIEEGDGVAPDPRTFTDNDDWECEEYIESNEEHSRPTNAQYSPTSREYDYGTGHNMRNSFDSCEDPSFEQYSRSGHYAESAHSRARPRPHDAYYDRRDSSRKSTSRVPHDGHSTYRYDFRNGRSERTAEIYRDKDSSRPRMQNSRRTTYDDYWRDPHLSSGRSRHNHGDSYDDDFRQRRSKTVPIGTQYQHSDAHGTDYHSRRPRTYDDYDNPIQHKTSHRSAPSSDRASYTTEHIQKINEAYSKTLSVITIGAQLHVDRLARERNKELEVALIRDAKRDLFAGVWKKDLPKSKRTLRNVFEGFSLLVKNNDPTYTMVRLGEDVKRQCDSEGIL